MGIWIRSQKKTNLVCADMLHVTVKRNASATIRAKASNDDVFAMLGSYESEAGAIQVLDMIQEYIAKGRGQMEDYGNGKTIVSDVVFQMPEADFNREGD